MAKLTLSNISTAGVDWTTLINTVNANNDAIEVALENTLSRDGTAPNYMDAVLDMNDNRIINVPTPIDATDGVNKQYVDDEIAAIPVGGGGGGTSDHGLLNGLEDDDHPQYGNIADTEEITGYWEFQNPDGITIVADPLTYSTFCWIFADEDFTGPGTYSAGAIDLQVNKDGVANGFCYAAVTQYDDATGGGHLAATDSPFWSMGRYAGDGTIKLNVGDVIGKITWETKNESTSGGKTAYEIQVVYEGAGTGTTPGASLAFKNHAGTVWQATLDGGLVGYSAGTAATGGSQGPGTINCKGIYVDGVAVSGGGGSVATLGDIGDVTITAVATGEVLMRSGSLWINRTLAEAGIAATSHNHAATQITSGTMATARLGSGTASSTTFLRGDSTWAVPAFTPTFSGVRAYKTGSQLITNNTYEAVTFNTENYDSDSYWPGSGSTFTVPSDGYYHIDAGIRWDTSTSGQRAIRIVAASVNVAESTVTPSGSINTCLSTSCDVYLSAGASVIVYAGLYNGSGDRSLNVSGQTTFCSIHKIA